MRRNVSGSAARFVGVLRFAPMSISVTMSAPGRSSRYLLSKARHEVCLATIIVTEHDYRTYDRPDLMLRFSSVCCPFDRNAFTPNGMRRLTSKTPTGQYCMCLRV